MSKQPITFRKLGIVALFTVSCFLLVLMLWNKSGGPSPLKPNKYRVHVLLPQASGLGTHSDVRAAGVTIGHVTSVSAAPAPHLGRADVTVELERPFAPLHADALARLRGKSILGEAYVALSLGSGQGKVIPEDGTLSPNRAQPAVAADEVFDTYDAATRRALQVWQQTDGAAIAGHGEDLNAVAGTLRPWAVDATTLLAIVQDQGKDVTALLRNGGEIAGGLADRSDAIQLLARSGDRAFNATGSQAENLKATFRELPGFERESELTLRRLTRLADARTDDVRTLRTELTPLSGALQTLSQQAPSLHRALAATPKAEKAGRAGFPALEKLLEHTPPFLSDLDPFLRSLNPALRYVATGSGQLNSFIANVAAATQASTLGSGSPDPLHYLRILPVLSPTVLAPLTKRPGVNRANPYPRAGTLELPGNRSVYDTRSCSAPTPPISPDPSPNLDQESRDEIGLYVYVPDAQNVAAPPCKPQGPAVGFGTSFPALTADPPNTP